ncbi:MAG: hypothetical protein AAF690_08730 [Acidobacteriota bacterium]
MKCRVVNAVLVLSVGCGLLGVTAGQAQGGGALLNPPAPTSLDVIEVEVSGTWRDACVPEFHGVPQPIEVSGNELTLRLDAVVPPDVNCGQALTNFSATTEIGPLAAGSYELVVLIGDGPGSTPTLWAEKSFSVLGDFRDSGGLAIEPAVPTATDNTRLLVWGIWRDGCVPERPVVSRDGSSITVLAVSSNFVCTQATEKFAFSADLGALPEGDYDVEVRVDDGQTTQTYGRTSFSVLPGAQSVLLSDRFMVSVDWGDFDGGTGIGSPVPVLSDDTASFWFFDQDNWEMLVKTLDGCGVNGHYWVFSSAATDVAFTLTVTDTVTSVTRTYQNPLGNRASAITDTSAFPCN